MPGENRPHFEAHGVSTEEIVEFFTDTNYFEERRPDDSYLGYGQLRSGRILKVIYRKLEVSYLFVFNAYDLEDQVIIDYLKRNLP